MGNELEVISQNQNTVCWSPKEVLAQIQIIQQLMRDGMTENEHWGKIPGCGDKPALLKPGAEKLGLMFRLAGKYEVQEINLPNGHLDVKVKCSLQHIVTGAFWGEGLGSCSTMESKYRYRSGAGASTGVPVPKDYWDLKRMGKFKEAQERIGAGYATAKLDPITGKPDKESGIWFIVEKIDKVENPDIADTYNTVRKIAKKRAFVDAMLSATAASDIFTQDIDEMFGTEEKKEEKPVKLPAHLEIESQEPPKMPKSVQEAFISHSEQLEIHTQAKTRGIAPQTLRKALKEVFGVDGAAKITQGQYPKVIEWLITHESAEVGQ